MAEDLILSARFKTTARRASRRQLADAIKNCLAALLSQHQSVLVGEVVIEDDLLGASFEDDADAFAENQVGDRIEFDPAPSRGRRMGFDGSLPPD